MCDARPAGIKPMVNAFAEADLRDVLGRIAVPTLLLYGELDQRSPIPVAQDLYARIPNAELVMMPSTGHVSNVEAPELFNREVHRFLKSVPT